MFKITEIKKYSFVKYLKCLYLVKDLQKLANGKYRLNYFFRTINKDKAKLHINDYAVISGHFPERIKSTTIEEQDLLIAKIKFEYPNFDLSFIETRPHTVMDNGLTINETYIFGELKVTPIVDKNGNVYLKIHTDNSIVIHPISDNTVTIFNHNTSQ